MKKIIELAEKYSESVKNNETVFSQVKRKKELLAAIKEYRTLQAAPITEDWLKEHGFVQNEYRNYEYDLYLNDREDEIRYYQRGGERDSTMSIYRNIEMEDEVCYELPEPYTVAQLLDACELCGLNELADNFKV